MFRECLKQIGSRCPGLLGASLVGRDGLPIDSFLVEQNHDMEMLSAELVALAQAARENHSEFGGGPLRSVLVETEDHVLLLGEAAEEVYLLLFLRRSASGADIARARFELRRAPLTLVPALFGEDLDDSPVELETGGLSAVGSREAGDTLGFGRSLPATVRP